MIKTKINPNSDKANISNNTSSMKSCSNIGNLNSNAHHRADIKLLTMTSLFTAVICVMAQISIPIQPIPFTLALFSIFLTGALLPPRYAFLSVMAYILLGAFGLPVFARFQGGLQVLVGMTGGYVAAYPLMAVITSLFYKHARSRKILALLSGMLLSLAACYLIGTLWFIKVSGMNVISALSVCVLPFIPFDIIKIVLAISISTVIRKTIYIVKSDS